ncbi:unnamed protein product [Clavelina lepadiformis]|uniref:Caspase activity and apoptosis inhibitor 1 n=1 Tax=Clavelina lepadiformis TaxID=159417 RepID=A0ABP0GHU5_CLALP
MSAYRQAMLSVAPERVEQFSLELKQTIDDKKRKKTRSGNRVSDKSKTHSRSHKASSSDKSKRSKGSSKSHSSSRRKKTSREQEKSSKKRKHSKSDEEHLTGDSDVEKDGLDLENELYPLMHYVKDRQKLMQTIFSIIRGEKLVAMLPDILKKLPQEEIKQRCFSHLEVMSSKRINHILAGKQMQSSSGTDSEPELDKNNEAQPKTILTNLKQSSSKEDGQSLQTNFVDSTTSSGCEVLSLLAGGQEQEVVPTSNPTLREEQQLDVDFSQSDDEIKTDENVCEVQSDSATSKNEANTEGTDDADEEEDIAEEVETVEFVEDEEYQDMVDAMLEESLPQTEASDVEQKSPDPKTPTDKGQTSSGRSQLELLELQLRERAIKSLLRAAQSSGESKS